MTRLHEIAMERILQDIVDGKLAPGEWLPRELDLAGVHSMSRGITRETIQALRERGLVDVRHGRGQWVLSDDHWNLLDLRVLLAVVTSPRLDLIREFLEARRHVQPVAAELAAERATETEMAALSEALERMRDAMADRRQLVALEDSFVKAELAFHHAMVATTGNRPLVRMLEPVHLALAVARHQLVEGHHQALIRQLDQIRLAIVAHEGKRARQAVEDTVRQLERWLPRR